MLKKGSGVSAEHAEITAFLDPKLFPAFGLGETLA